jgi:hypothetical protein
MAHDHNEKIHTCEPCGYWHVANGRFEIIKCKGCGEELSTYSSRQWAIDNISPLFEGIPKERVWHFGLDGFVKPVILHYE